MYKLRPFTTTEILTSIYYAIIYPFLLYGITVWGTACNTCIAPILILQKRFVRLATYNDTYPDVPGPLSHTISLFHRLKILKIFDIFKLQLGKLVYESINNIIIIIYYFNIINIFILLLLLILTVLNLKKNPYCLFVVRSVFVSFEIAQSPLQYDILAF